MQSKAAMVVSGANEHRNPEILGLRIGDSESKAFWVKQRGFNEVRYGVSDDHSGLVNAARRFIKGAIWQCCRIHFMRNVLSHPGAKHKKEMGEGFKQIFSSDNANDARQRFDELAEQMEKKTSKAIDCLERGLEDSLAVMTLPNKYTKAPEINQSAGTAGTGD